MNYELNRIYSLLITIINSDSLLTILLLLNHRAIMKSQLLHHYWSTIINHIAIIQLVIPWIITINQYESPLNHHPTHQPWPLSVSQQAITWPPCPKSTASTGPSPQASKWRNNEPSSAMAAPRPRKAGDFVHQFSMAQWMKTYEKAMKSPWKTSEHLEMMAKWKKTYEKPLKGLWKRMENHGKWWVSWRSDMEWMKMMTWTFTGDCWWDIENQQKSTIDYRSILSWNHQIPKSAN